MIHGRLIHRAATLKRLPGHGSRFANKINPNRFGYAFAAAAAFAAKCFFASPTR